MDAYDTTRALDQHPTDWHSQKDFFHGLGLEGVVTRRCLQQQSSHDMAEGDRHRDEYEKALDAEVVRSHFGPEENQEEPRKPGEKEAGLKVVSNPGESPSYRWCQSGRLEVI